MNFPQWLNLIHTRNIHCLKKSGWLALFAANITQHYKPKKILILSQSEEKFS